MNSTNAMRFPLQKFFIKKNIQLDRQEMKEIEENVKILGGKVACTFFLLSRELNTRLAI